MNCYLHLHGLEYFLKRPHLWRRIACPILATFACTVVSLVALLAYALGPQANFIIEKWGWKGWAEWLAWLASFLMVLAEVALANMVLFLALFGCVQSALFRSVLEDEGILSAVVQESGRTELREATICSDCRHGLLFLLVRLPLLIVTLPLHGFPVLGQVAWCVLNGWLYTWELTAEFLVLYEDRTRCGSQWRFVKQRLCSYTSFGAIAMALELVPFLGPWIFFATNACAAGFLAEEFFSERHHKQDGQWVLVDQPRTTAPNPKGGH